jgi:DNA polymerase-3 subunit epsilon
VGLKEAEDLHIIDHWCYLGTAKNEAEVHDIIAGNRPAFDKDTYMILSKALKKTKNIIQINSKQAC